ncbi:hypothetical protein BN946_scf184754.g5 [Trametes cinnabarina]|uniref:Transposase family Tnp2 protein n=1 Tax=Pycnoporus cinnabarinus TaxID=5643 RepID=A0A060S2S6_PYCCI|nr:hypothetical protein BN946_scf184754.g5 [Trametes cinnabarina]
MSRDVNPASRVTCECCGQLVSTKTARAHRRGRAPVLLRAAAHAIRKKLGRGPNALPEALAEAIPVPQPEIGDVPVPLPTNSVNDEEQMQLLGVDPVLPEAPEDVVAAATQTVQQRVWQGRPRCATVEDDSEPDDEDLGANHSGSADSRQRHGDYEVHEECQDWEDCRETEGDREFEAISVWDRLTESFLRSGLISGLDLTEEDLQFLRPFALKVETHMPGKTFSKLPFAFPQCNLESWKSIQARVAQISGFAPEIYDCCISSCMAYTGIYEQEASCPFCQEPRRDTLGRARQHFVYLPIIPRLKAQYANRDMANKLQYRAKDHHYEPGTIKDVMDSVHYQSLLTKNVVIGEHTLPHRYLQDPRDAAFGLSTDGFAPFKRRSKTAWPLILVNYNLPPEVRTHLDNLMGLGVIPGPKKPIDFDSFLWPLAQEFLRLAVGVHAYDSLTDEFFALRAYLILVFGDIPAISMVMRMKGHNGACPCRMCSIRGIPIPDSRNNTLYVPLDRTRHPTVQNSPAAIKTYDPDALPLRTHEQFLQQAHEVQFARTGAEEERLAKQYGIKGIPLLSSLSSLSFPDSFPYDFMHLIWENVVKNLMNLWTGQYKGLDCGTGDYTIEPTVWDAIGAASAESGGYIPYVFGPRPPNVASDKTSWTADTRSFWTQYVGPVLLERRFKHRRYYDHFVQLVKVIRQCLQFEITHAEVAEIRTNLVQWVLKYEELYYQYEPERLPTCLLTIHALLHIADSIIKTGPVWATWAFPMERYCGALQPAIRSRRFPYASINRYVVDHARLTQIKLVYGGEIRAKLTLMPRPIDKGRQVPGWALCTRFDTIPPHIIRRALPREVSEWGKVRILNEGDTIRAAALDKPGGDKRDATFVRYEVLVDQNARFRHAEVALQPKTLYGQLQHIFEVQLAPMPSHGYPDAPSSVILAAIQTCQIQRSNLPLDIHYYTRMGATDYVDVQTIQCLVGRIKDRGHFAIIDRSGSLSRVLFVDSDEPGE